MAIEQNVWAFSPEGEAIIIYTLTDSSGSSVRLTNLGAAIVSITVPDRNGNMADVVLGYADPLSYFNDGAAMGKTVGRFANRIGGGRFTLDGTEYRLPLTGKNVTLHGGPQNFAGKLWESRVEDNTVKFSLVSPAGDQGFPGELGAEVIYEWTDRRELVITFLAACDAPTIVNLTNHAYFNLAGESAGSILGHRLQINGRAFLAMDDNQVPTGELVDVEGTPMDFRTAKSFGQDIDADFKPLKQGAGYDHAWTINGYGDGRMNTAAVLSDPASGRTLEIITTQPSLQVYTGNFLQGGPKSKSGEYYDNRDGVALECQGYPDSPNHPQFPSQVLRPGETYCENIIYKFSADKCKNRRKILILN